jgi:enoyl-CoA hydratase/carnithine racemase
MTSATVIRTDRDGLATLTLNRPEKLNSLNTEMFVALGEHVSSIRASTATIGCVVIRGAGRCFSAGHDLGALGEPTPPPYLNYKATIVEQLANLPQPVVSAVHGYCYTGALELALAGDIILASANARFADTHGKWGLTPIWGMSQRLPRRIGAARARELMLTCRTVTGAEAERMGLANGCFEDAGFDDEVEKFARSVLENSWFSNAANKRLLIETDGLPLAAGLAHESYRTEGRAPDAAERVARFSKSKA